MTARIWIISRLPKISAVAFRSLTNYRNYMWHIDGDKKASGNSLRVLHPCYPDHCLTSSMTPENSELIREIRGKCDGETLRHVGVIIGVEKTLPKAIKALNLKLI